MNITDDVTNLNEFESYNDLKDSELFLNMELIDKVHILRLAQSKFNSIKDQITDDLLVFEKKLHLGFFVSNLVSQLNNLEIPASKIQYLEKNHERLKILLIANKYKDKSDIYYTEQFIEEELNIINDFLEKLRPIPELPIDKDASSISEENIKPVNIEEIEQLANSLPAKIVLLYELGIYDILKQRIKENNLPRTDLAKLISYVINEKSANYVYSYLSNTDLDPFNNNYHDEAKDNPFTHTAIKAMTRILLDCNLKVEKGYPTKIKPNRKERDKK